MFKTKKDIDRHVRANLAKLNENERKYRGFTIAKLYYKINEFSTASNYLSDYLSVCKERPSAYKLFGQCLLKINNVDQALESFQKSLQLDEKQPDVLAEVCKILLSKDSLSNYNAEYWCNLAESENVEDSSVLNLRLKLAEKDRTSNELIQNHITDKIDNNPNDPGLRIQYLQYLMKQGEVIKAFKYAINLEISKCNIFSESFNWYETLLTLLAKLKPLIDVSKDWEFILLRLICLEKQVNISFSTTDNFEKSNNTENFLFEFDQYLNDVTQLLRQELCVEFKMTFWKHFRGQLCMHIASILLKKHMTKDNTKKVFLLLLFAYQSGPVDLQQEWIKSLEEKHKQLVYLWNHESSFRCLQAGRTILSCANNLLASTEKNMPDTAGYLNDEANIQNIEWTTSMNFLSDIQDYCSNKSWKTNIYREIFGDDKMSKMSSSYFVSSQDLSKPNFNIPSNSDVECFFEDAQKFQPQSLQHMTYLWLDADFLTKHINHVFPNKMFSTNNLACCSAETLNILDMESFLYASVIQASRSIELYTNQAESTKRRRQFMLPFVNVQTLLCTEAQSNWWKLACNALNGVMDGKLAEIRTTLKYGIEAVRGINDQKMDLFIILKLGKIFAQRSDRIRGKNEKNFFEARARTLYKHGLQVLKRSKGLSEAHQMLFSYPAKNMNLIQQQKHELTEDAVQYVVRNNFQEFKYQECIDLLNGVKSPLATYYISEAYKNLESVKMQNKIENYNDNSCDPLSSIFNESLNLNRNSNFVGISSSKEANKIKCNAIMNEILEIPLENLNLSNSNNSNGGDKKLENSIMNSEHLIKEIAETLSFLKGEIIDFVRPEVKALRSDIANLKEKINMLEEKVNIERPETLGNVDLNDYLIVPTNVQNDIYPSHSQQSFTLHNIDNMQTKQQIDAANMQQQILNSFKSPLFNSNYLGTNNFPQFATPVSQPRACLNSFQRTNQINSGWMLGNQQIQNENLSNNVAPPQNTGIEAQKINEFLSLLNQTGGVYSSQPKSATPLGFPTLQQTQLQHQSQLPQQPQQHLQQQLQQQPQPIQGVSTLPSYMWNENIFNSGIPENVDLRKPFSIPNTKTTLPAVIPLLQNNTSIFSSPVLETNTTLTTPRPLFGEATMKSNINFSTNNSGETPSFDCIGSFTNTSVRDSSDFENKDDYEYDPRPDFQPIIPLPAEIKINTGEENEEVLFSHKAKLFRFVDKEWKERGCGDIKILKNREDGKGRVLMRRDLTHKICANHKITNEMNLVPPSSKKDDKCFIWAAHDYADEELKVEKFCIRFKQSEVAREFYDAFTKVKENAESADSGNTAWEVSQTDDSIFNQTELGHVSTESKSLSSEDKPSIFKNLNLGISSSAGKKPFDFLNNTQATNQNFSNIPNITEKQNNDKVLNKSFGENSEDDYVPTAQFKPLIALPDLVEMETGEENEAIIFEHRAKLLRYDKQLSEWKERGIGNIKILQDRDNYNKIRLVMRREKVQKLCCNQNLLKETKFIYPKTAKTKNSLIWIGQDFSENELVTETFSLKFKTEETCKSFLDLILKLQEKMEDNKIMKKEKSIEKNEEKAQDDKKIDKESVLESFGDKFKPKPGSWSCKECYVQNSPDSVVCISCNVSKNDDKATNLKGNIPTPFTGIPVFSFGFNNSLNDKSKDIQKPNDDKMEDKSKEKLPEGFGDKFKPKVGSWSCKECYVQNSSDAPSCVSCNTHRNEEKAASLKGNIMSSVLTATPIFSFGFSNAFNNPKEVSRSSEEKDEKQNKENISDGFGDKFKPKAGSWSCKECYVLNSSDIPNCVSCNSPKNDANATNIKENISTASTGTPVFSFGFNTSSPFSLNASKDSNLTFGFNTSTANTPTTFGFKNESNSFGISFKSNEKQDPLKTQNFAINSETGKLNNTQNNFTVVDSLFKPNADITNIQTIPNASKISSLFNKTSEPNLKSQEDSERLSFGKKEFNFNFDRIKSFGKSKSPTKLNTSNKEDTEASGEEFEEEENNSYFTPVVHLEKVDVKTGEEEEEVLYSHRAKLFRFVNKEWKERGLGDVKILRHRQSNKLRVIMRREQIHKICLNHVLNPGIEYKAKDTKSWLFAVNDYSEGEIEPMQFCIRFKTNGVAEDFIKAIKKALSTDSSYNSTKENLSRIEGENKSSDDDLLLEKLFLPVNFFEENHKCDGCRGCDSENFVFPVFKEDQSVIEEQNPLPLEMNISKIKISKKKSNVLKNSSFILPNLEEKKKEDGQNDSNSGFFKINKSDNLNSRNSVAPENPFKNSIFQDGFSFGNSNLNFGSNEKETKLLSSQDHFIKPFLAETDQKSTISPFGNNIFNQIPVFGSSSFKSTTLNSNILGELNPDNKTSAHNEPFINSNANNNYFKTNSSLVDFASLAKSANGSSFDQPNQKNIGEFFGLTQQDSFKNFSKPEFDKDDKNSQTENNNSKSFNEDDPNFDPYYKPIIELPKEISVSTGEENEIKIFGERGTLFRYDDVNKEWKERGVGEMKILHHSSKGTYRFLLRREQIHKLVLNHTITADFAINNMNNSLKAFCWGAMNYAEDTPQSEKLAVRFKNADLANKFINKVNECKLLLKNLGCSET